MGTEIQANAFFPKNHHMIDLNGNGRNSLMSLRHDNQMTGNGQDADPAMTQAYQNGYSVNDLDKMRQTILMHESVFRSQLQELHRVYRKQRDLMNEFNMAEIKKSPNLTPQSLGDVSGNPFSNPQLEPKDFFKSSLDRMDRGLAIGNSELRNRRTWNECQFDGQSERRMGALCDTQDFCPAKSQMSSESLLPVSRNGSLSSPLENGESYFPKKRKIFGIEIPEGSNDSYGAAVCRIDSRMAEPFWMKETATFKQNATPRLENHHMASTLPPSWNSNYSLQNVELLGKSVKDGCASVGLNTYGGLDQRAGSDSETPKGGLPWFLRNTQSNGEPSKGAKSSYFMNLDSLQNCSQTFFTRAEIANGSFLRSKQKKETSAPVNVPNVEGVTNGINNKSQAATMILGFPISDMLHSFKDSNTSNNVFNHGSAGEAKNDENGPGNSAGKSSLDHVSNLRHHIDLNLALDEEDDPPAASLPTVVKIATTEIDLEGPAAIEPEADVSLQEPSSTKTKTSRGESETSYEERDKSAADALICISCFGGKRLMDDEAPELPEAESTDCLKWFAEIIASQIETLVDQNTENRVSDEEDPILEGMDVFEFMTLRLEDTKDKNYMYNPMKLNIPNDEETNRDATVHKSSRRGHSRRGRQQKDFQRDILPAIATLSRHEMKEDVKVFEEIYKGEGSAQNLSKSNSMKKGKSRKRAVGPSTPPQAKQHCSNRPQQEPVSQELRLVQGSLVGWGKKTRRMPRQRCQSPYLSQSLPVKC